MSSVRPLSVAVIRHPPAATSSMLRKARVAVVTFADREGYSVAEVFETYGNSRIDETIANRLIDVADRLAARAVLTYGDIGEPALATIAGRSTLAVFAVPNWASAAGRRSASPVEDVCAGYVDDPRSAWTGRLDFELRTDRDSRSVGTVEVAVRLDTVTLYYVSRTLAVMHRDAFRDWLIHPDDLLTVDDVSWSVRGTYLYLTIDEIHAYPVPSAAVRQLVAVV